MYFRRLACFAFIVVAMLAAASTAQARFLSVVCPRSADAQVDPIVSPGIKPSAHLHSFYSALNVTENSTVQSLESGGTSCKQGAFAGARSMTAAEVKGSTAGMWIPAMYMNGVEITDAYIADYWSTSGIPSGATIHNMPEGLQFVIGDSHATTPPPKYEIYWNCGGSFTSTWPSLNVPRNDCPNISNKTLQAHITLPGCWDGTGLGVNDTTFAPVVDPNFQQAPRFKACPAAFPIQLPHVQMIIHTKLHGNVSGLSFSSGPPATLHGDYWQTWNQQTLINAENWLRTGKLP